MNRSVLEHQEAVDIIQIEEISLVISDICHIERVVEGALAGAAVNENRLLIAS